MKWYLFILALVATPLHAQFFLKGHETTDAKILTPEIHELSTALSKSKRLALCVSASGYFYHEKDHLFQRASTEAVKAFVEVAVKHDWSREDWSELDWSLIQVAITERDKSFAAGQIFSAIKTKADQIVDDTEHFFSERVLGWAEAGFAKGNIRPRAFHAFSCDRVSLVEGG